MKAFIKLFLLQFVFILTPLLIALIAVSSQPFSTARIKQQLATSGIYTQVLDTLEDQLTHATSSTPDDELMLKVWPLVRTEITPSYLQTKTETLIDDTQLWVSGKTNTIPVLSFQDLKENLVMKNKKVLNQIILAVEEMKEEQTKLRDEALVNGEAFDDQTYQQLENFNPQTIIESDWIIPLGKHLEWLKSLIMFINFSIPVLLSLIVVIFIFMVILSDSLKSKLRWAGITLLAAGLGSGLYLILQKFISSLITQITAQNTQTIPAFIEPLITNLTSPYIRAITSYQETVAIGLLMAFVACMIGASLLPHADTASSSGIKKK